MKLITSRYASRCGHCKGLISAGDRVYWQKGYKPLHVACFTASNGQSVPSPVSATSPASSKSASGGWNDFVIDWVDAKDLLLKATSGQSTGLSATNDRRMREDLRGGDWAGFTSGQLNRWLTAGYETAAIQGLQGLAPPLRKKRRTLFTDDGETIEVDRLISREDNFMSTHTKREVIPGCKLNIELDASATSSQSLFAFQKWIAATIYALEESGVDCEVTIYTLSRALFDGQGANVTRTAIRVKREGEIADFVSVSPMFSPAAFRGIIFSLFSAHANAKGLKQISHGSGVTDTWSVKFHPETESIEVRCDWKATMFPESVMTAQFQTALKDLQRGY